MSREIRVATSNTKLGHMVRTEGGLEPVGDVDVLLLQETHTERDDLEERLQKDTDLELTMSTGGLGLAVAVRKGLPVEEARAVTFIERGRFSRFAVCHLGDENIAAFRMRARGLLAVSVEIDDAVVDFVNIHAPVAFYPPGRRLYTSQLANYMNTSHADRPVIVGGDWNSWPRPSRRDRRMWESAGLSHVDIHGVDTFSTQGTIFENVSDKLQRVSGLAERIGFDPSYFSWDGELDAVLYRDPENALQTKSAHTVETASDHDAIIASFTYQGDTID